MFICSDLAGSNTILADSPQDTSDLSRLVKVNDFLLPIIPPSSGVQFYKDKIVFVSLSKNERKIPPDHISFGTIENYYASVEDSATGSHIIFTPGFSYPGEAMTFNQDYSEIYFSKPDRKVNKEKIYMARLGMNEKNVPVFTSGPVALDFCTDNSNYSHPALSSDGKMLIFASDKEGSRGGMDLFVSRQSGGKWSLPENMGTTVNTSGNEYFPFLDNDNNLYFSSDKLPGNGGYDLFSCKFNGESWNKPVKMPDHINSANDEIAITINRSDGKTGFFTRKSGEKNMKLYRLSLSSESPGNLIAVFNGYPAAKPELPATVADKTEPVKPRPDTVTTTKTEQTVTQSKAEEKKVPASTVAVSKVPAAKSVIIKPTLPLPQDQKDVVIYRVQITSSNNPKREKTVMVGGRSYSLYEYFYLGSYRYSVGEFRNVQEALELQRICRQTEFPQAFVAAFKNNTRSTDLKTFK